MFETNNQSLDLQVGEILYNFVVVYYIHYLNINLNGGIVTDIIPPEVKKHVVTVAYCFFYFTLCYCFMMPCPPPKKKKPYDGTKHFKWKRHGDFTPQEMFKILTTNKGLLSDSFNAIAKDLLDAPMSPVMIKEIHLPIFQLMSENVISYNLCDIKYPLSYVEYDSIELYDILHDNALNLNGGDVNDNVFDSLEGEQNMRVNSLEHLEELNGTSSINEFSVNIDDVKNYVILNENSELFDFIKNNKKFYVNLQNLNDFSFLDIKPFEYPVKVDNWNLVYDYYTLKYQSLSSIFDDINGMLDEYIRLNKLSVDTKGEILDFDEFEYNYGNKKPVVKSKKTYTFKFDNESNLQPNPVMKFIKKYLFTDAKIIDKPAKPTTKEGIKIKKALNPLKKQAPMSKEQQADYLKYREQYIRSKFGYHEEPHKNIKVLYTPLDIYLHKTFFHNKGFDTLQYDSYDDCASGFVYMILNLHINEKVQRHISLKTNIFRGILWLCDF